MHIHDCCREAGVVGAGGAGFPTHIKLNAKAEIVLANGAECEPLLRVDQQLMIAHTREIIRGMRLAMDACGAGEGVFCIKAKHKNVIAAMEAACESGMRVFPLRDYYPAGDEQQMAYDAVGRIVPVGGIPIDAGIVVQNVSTLRNIALACDQHIPVTHKHVTITGEVKTPVTLNLPIGMSIRQGIALAGGPACEQGYGLIVGGPMMGYVENNWDGVITKTTGGLIVLRADHLHYARKAAPKQFNEKMARSVCCQCMLCSQMCPRNLLGLGVHPHMAMRAKAYGTELQENGAFSCCNCGICSYFACPFSLMPSAMLTEQKDRLAASGAKPVKMRPEQAAPNRSYGLVPVKRLIMRLGLSPYDVAAPLDERPIHVPKVTIPTKMHIGAPCQPTVKVGDEVAQGDVIAKPEEGKLGVNIHASISGKVQSADSRFIVICAR